jgi:hypothetical protein
MINHFNQSGDTVTATPSASANAIVSAAFGTEGTKRQEVRAYNQTNKDLWVLFGFAADTPNTAAMLKGFPVAPGTDVILHKNEVFDTVFIMTEAATPTGKAYFSPGYCH